MAAKLTNKIPIYSGKQLILVLERTTQLPAPKTGRPSNMGPMSHKWKEGLSYAPHTSVPAHFGTEEGQTVSFFRDMETADPYARI